MTPPQGAPFQLKLFQIVGVVPAAVTRSLMAPDDAAFILGSAVKHTHDLVLGYYSVHTHPNALESGEANIARIGRELSAAGRLCS